MCYSYTYRGAAVPRYRKEERKDGRRQEIKAKAREHRPLCARGMKHQRGAAIYIGNSKTANETIQKFTPETIPSSLHVKGKVTLRDVNQVSIKD